MGHIYVCKVWTKAGLSAAPSTTFVKHHKKPATTIEEQQLAINY